MITKQKIKIYLKYQDIDNFARGGNAKEKNILNDIDWGLIDSLIQDIHLLKNNLISTNMKEEIERKIQEYTEGDDEFAKKLFLLK